MNGNAISDQNLLHACKGKQIKSQFSRFIEQAENVTMGNLCYIAITMPTTMLTSRSVCVTQ